MATLALEELAKSQKSASAHKTFEFCDYAVSTITMGFCSGYRSEIENVRRERFYNSLKASMNSNQQSAFDKLLIAKNDYVKTHASEVDQGGTIRAIRTNGSQNILEKLFYMEVVQWERKKWPTLSDRQVASADALLQREYGRKMDLLGKRSKESIEQGAPTAENLALVEKSWQYFCDAWVTFASLRYPHHASAIRAQITLDRYRLLKTI